MQACLASGFLVQVMEDGSGPSWLGAHNQSRPGLRGQRGRAHNPLIGSTEEPFLG